MALRINTNVASTYAQVDLHKHTRQLVRTLGRISSGLRINSAADDPTGMAMATNLDSTGRSVTAATRNTNDGLTILQTSEGATNEVSDLLVRMRELALASSSSTMSTDERTLAHTDAQEMFTEIKRIAANTKYSSMKLTDGTLTNMDVQVGIDGDANSRINIKLANLSDSALSLNTTNTDISTTTKAQATVTQLDTAIKTINTYRSQFGSSTNRLTSALQGLQSYSSTVAIAQSNIQDADFAYETAQMTKLQIMQQSSISILAQANSLGSSALALL
jgi:flagellin